MTAVAPTVTISGVQQLHLDQFANFTANIAGGNYDSISYWWSATQGYFPNGRAAKTVRYNPPGVSISVTLTVTVTARNNDGTSATATASYSVQIFPDSDPESPTIEPEVPGEERPLDPEDPPIVPILSINGPATGNSGESATYEAVTQGGNFESIGYTWSGNKVTISGSGAIVTATYDQLSVDPSVDGLPANQDAGSISVVVTVGRQDLYRTVSQHKGILITGEVTPPGPVDPGPITPVAPSVSITGPSSLMASGQGSYEAHLSGGDYDTVTDYQWSIISSTGGSVSGSNRFATLYAPDAATSVVLRLRVTVRKSGVGTVGQATRTITISSTQSDVPTVTYVYNGAVVLAQLSSTTGVTAYQWQRYNEISEMWEGVPGATSTRLEREPGVVYRITWIRNSVAEYGPPADVYELDSEGSDFVIKGLKPSTQYTVEIRAVSKAGIGESAFLTIRTADI